MFGIFRAQGRALMRALILTLCLMSHGTLEASATTKPAAPITEEAHRKTQLQNRLCADRELSCAYVTAILNDPRLTIYPPPEPAVPPPAPVPKEHERNPYFTKRFGLLTSESLERCKDFIQAHLLAFDAAFQIYGVPKEVICGHLRIETDFGISTKLSPHPLGTTPAINRLVALYVIRPRRKQPRNRFVQRQAFALIELKDLLNAASKFGWDLFQVPGSSTGAIGLVQFEPSSFKFAVDGDGDGKIDLFDPEDAILSVAHYLATRGWDDQPQHQQRAIYAYYGGHYDADRNKYYMKAVLKYANEICNYLKDHPVETAPTSFPEPLTPEGQQTSRDQHTEQLLN
jgi:membrane-bound lytic murein transglycosylase B